MEKGDARRVFDALAAAREGLDLARRELEAEERSSGGARGLPGEPRRPGHGDPTFASAARLSEARARVEEIEGAGAAARRGGPAHAGVRPGREVGVRRAVQAPLRVGHAGRRQLGPRVEEDGLHVSEECPRVDGRLGRRGPRAWGVWRLIRPPRLGLRVLARPCTRLRAVAHRITREGASL